MNIFALHLQDCAYVSAQSTACPVLIFETVAELGRNPWKLLALLISYLAFGHEQFKRNSREEVFDG